jgi:internalin A
MKLIKIILLIIVFCGCSKIKSNEKESIIINGSIFGVKNEKVIDSIKKELLLYKNDEIEALTSISFKNQKINTIDGFNSYKLGNLVEIGLSDNQIVRIDNLNHISNLRKLYLSNNSLNRIANVDRIIKLEKLLIKNNKIKIIGGLDTLVNLRELDLSGNQITKIEGLDKLVNLEILSLSGNPIKKLEGLDNLVSLKDLTISSGVLTKIEGLDNLKSLEYLTFLECDGITQIEGLDGLGNLKVFNFNSGGMSFYPENMKTVKVGNAFDNLKNIETISFRGYLISAEDGNHLTEKFPNVFLDIMTPEDWETYKKLQGTPNFDEVE